MLILWLVRRDIRLSNLREFIKRRATVGAIGGIWAEIPEIDYLLEGTLFHTSRYSDIFFLHFSLDEILPETDLFFAAEMFLIFAVINLFALVTSVESFIRIKEALFGKEEDEGEEDEDEEKEGVEDRKNELNGSIEEKEGKPNEDRDIGKRNRKINGRL